VRLPLPGDGQLRDVLPVDLASRFVAPGRVVRQPLRAPAAVEAGDAANETRCQSPEADSGIAAFWATSERNAALHDRDLLVDLRSRRSLTARPSFDEHETSWSESRPRGPPRARS
jgi:hypothetical protein